MKYLRQRALDGEILCGVFCSLGSPVTVEIAGLAGFDWLLIDLEHGAGSEETVYHQLVAADTTSASPFVRIAANEPPRFKRVLDSGAMGVMVPWVSTVEQAQAAVSAIRYPGKGIRGVAKSHRGTRFGRDFEDYFPNAAGNLTLVVQIETVEGAANAADIAAVDGVDVLFVGPLDLSVSLGSPGDFESRTFKQTVAGVAKAARNAGKAAGILLQREDQLKPHFDLGFNFVALNSDLGLVISGMKQIAGAMAAAKASSSP